MTEPIFLQKPKYFPALDGVRGFAILLVVLLHNFSFVDYFQFGWLGVDLFFVLSGFLITESLLVTVGKPRFLRHFYIRRILRILPLYILLLICCLFILPQIKSFVFDMAYYTEHQIWFWTFLQNWLFIFYQPGSNEILIHTWSLAIEEQFYLIWPLLILLIRKPKALLATIMIVLFLIWSARILVWILQVENFSIASFYSFTRIDGLCIGSMIAILLKNSPSWITKNLWIILLSFAISNFAFYFISAAYGFSLPYFAFIGYPTLTMLFALLVYEAIIERYRIIKLIFTNKIMKFFGRISYGLYMFHWPMYVIGVPFFLKLFKTSFLLENKLALIASSLTITIMSIVVSAFSLRYFERIFLRLKKHFI